MVKFKKPTRLQMGDAVAIVSPSWGGPSIFPHVYENGLRELENFGLQIKEYPTARANDEFLAKNPQARARDINDAFADPQVKAIFISIGGDDSVRILPFLNPEIIRNNPKIIMGYSDTTTLLTYINQLGNVTFHGPSIMAGFSQAKSLPISFVSHIREMLFSPPTNLEYQSYESYCDGFPDWGNEKNVGKINELKQNTGWRFIQGFGLASGELFGGCIEVLETLNGTEFWPSKEFWDGKILFLETSEEKPSVERVRRMLRNYGMQGIFHRIIGVLIGRAMYYTDAEKVELDAAVLNVICEEFENNEIPIITNMDFGHTDPQFILPLGVRAEIDCTRGRFRLLESPLAD